MKLLELGATLGKAEKASYTLFLWRSFRKGWQVHMSIVTSIGGGILATPFFSSVVALGATVLRREYCLCVPVRGRPLIMDTRIMYVTVRGRIVWYRILVRSLLL